MKRKMEEGEKRKTHLSCTPFFVLNEIFTLVHVNLDLLFFRALEIGFKDILLVF
jgi:hypothetical protein